MRRQHIFFIGFFLVACISMDGCYSVRKKFIRKRKKEEEPQVYLFLKDYTNIPAEKVYRDYYVFVRGWLDELYKSLQEGISQKRNKKAIDEAMVNFSQMTYFLDEEGKKASQELFDEFMSIREYLYTAAVIPDASRWADKVDRLKRKFEKAMSYEAVQSWIRQPPVSEKK